MAFCKSALVYLATKLIKTKTKSRIRVGKKVYDITKV